jgi:hypothetical protein
MPGAGPGRPAERIMSEFQASCLLVAATCLPVAVALSISPVLGVMAIIAIMGPLLIAGVRSLD